MCHSFRDFCSRLVGRSVEPGAQPGGRLDQPSDAHPMRAYSCPTASTTPILLLRKHQRDANRPAGTERSYRRECRSHWNTKRGCRSILKRWVRPRVLKRRATRNRFNGCPLDGRFTPRYREAALLCPTTEADKRRMLLRRVSA